MAPGSIDSGDRGVQGVRRIAEASARGLRGAGLRHRLDVIAPTVAGVVRYTGGWLFDRVMAGWDVTVHVADHTDPQPLRILGARVLDLEGTLARRLNAPFPHALAVDVQLCRADPRAHTMVLAALRCC